MTEKRGKCSGCKRVKELTPHGCCFRCHIKTVNLNRRMP